jgi:elongation factor Ts
MLRSSAVRIFTRSYIGRHVGVTSNFVVESKNLVAAVVPTRRGFADFSMAQLKDLRSLSGAPIVDCKKALTETEGDLDQAMDWLRQHGAAKASQKVSGRDAEEGLVACVVAQDGKSASLVKVSSETDFAGKSPAFVNFVMHVADATLTADSDSMLEPQSVLALESDSKSVQTALEEAIVAIRENLGVSSAMKLTTDDHGMLVAYVHGKAADGSNAGSAAAIVEISGEGVDPETMRTAGKKLAMHIVAAKPLYLDPESVPSDVIEKEKEILKSQVSTPADLASLWLLDRRILIHTPT